MKIIYLPNLITRKPRLNIAVNTCLGNNSGFVSNDGKFPNICCLNTVCAFGTLATSSVCSGI